MAKVLIAVATQLVIVPVGPAQGKMRIAIMDEAGAAVLQSQDVDLPAAEFLGVTEGNYLAAAQRLDVDGNAVPGVAAITKAFNVPAETMSVDAPVEVQISVTLGASGAAGIQ